MTQSIVLSVSHPDREPGKVEGFNFFWAYYVNGFRPDKHCQPCFKGRPIPEFNSASAGSGQAFALDRMHQYPYLYVCGVGGGPVNQRYKKNFHLPLRYEEGESVSAVTYNGYRVVAQNAVLLQIPALPRDWSPHGTPMLDSMRRCKNFQFAVEYFGYPTEPVPLSTAHADNSTPNSA